MASWFKAKAGSSAAPLPDGKPLLLIGFNDSTQHWELGEEALQVVGSIRGPLSALAVCGRARQGKSFLLNQLLGKLSGRQSANGFVVSPTHQSCTRGLWIWSVPVPVSAPDGSVCNTLLIDCEGVDAYDQGQQHSAQVFSLAVLLSSTFVYNQLGAIDAIAIERLAMVCELAKHIKQKAGSGQGYMGGGEQVDFHPAFMWLLRDFQLELREGGRKITPRQYLEETLALVPAGSGRDAENRNQMRETIKAVFPDRDAFTLVRPALTEEQLNRLDTLPASALRPEFKQGLEEFTNIIRARTRPLRFAGQLVSGAAYAGLASAYVKAINEGAVPQLVTAWQGVARAECGKAAEAGLAAYVAAFKENVDGDDQDLYQEHQRALGVALARFKENALGDAALQAEFEEKIRQGAEARFTEVKRKRHAQGERAASELLAAESSKLNGMMRGPDANLAAVEGELRSFLAEYDRRFSGPFKYKKAAEFLMNIILAIRDVTGAVITARDGALKRATEAEAALAQARQELNSGSGRAAAAEARVTALQRDLAAAQEHANRAAADAAARARQLQEAQAEASRLASQLSSRSGAEASLQAQLAAAQRAAESARAAAGEREAALQRQLASAGAAAAAAASQSAALQRRVEVLEAEASEAAAGRAELLAAKGALAGAQQEAAAARAEVGRVEGALAGERERVTRTLEDLARLQADLAEERTAHDQTKASLGALRAAAASGATPGPSSVRGAAAASAGTARANKRRRQGEEDGGVDEEMEDAAPLRGVGATTPSAPASASPAPGPAPSSSPPPTAAELAKMTVPQLKSWVTDHRLEDAEFLRLATNSKTKKANWVEYVTAKVAGMDGVS